MRAIHYYLLAFAFLFLSKQSFAQLPTAVVSSNIESNTTWSNDTVYQLDGFIYVKNNATLTIEEGTIIQGYINSSNVNSKGTLIVTQDGYINAQGTECSPIIFTSAEAPGSRNAGDWGGLVILGEASLNSGTDQGGYYTDVMEGGLTGDVLDRTYGGSNDGDSSGVLSYVRIEYSGIALLSLQEINGLTLAGVGSRTALDHIMISHCGDDALSIQGGDAELNYVVVTTATDDDIDFRQGARGSLQFVILYKEASTADLSKSQGIESENSSSDANATPRTAPILSNLTIVGPYATGSPHSNHQSSIRNRRGAWTSVHNSAILDNKNGLYIDGDDAYNGWNSGMEFKGNVMAGMNNFYKASGSHTTSSMHTLWIAANDTTSTSALGLDAGYSSINDPQLKPSSSSSLLSGSDWTFTGASDFTQVSYRGAIGSTDWTTGWTNWNPQNTNYNYPGPSVDSVAQVNLAQGVYRAYWSGFPSGADRFIYQWRGEGETSWRTKSASNTSLTSQKFNVAPWFNTNVEYRLGARYNGTDTTFSCIYSVAIPCRPMTVQTAEQASATCVDDSALVRVGYAGGYGAKTILWSNGATVKRTYADPGETLTVTVTDATGCSVTEQITANSLSNTSAAPSNVSTSRNVAIVTVSWTAASFTSGQSLVGYRVYYRLRGSGNAWSQTSLTSSTSMQVDMTSEPTGNYEFTVATRYLDNGTGTTSSFACFSDRGWPGISSKNDSGSSFQDNLATKVYPNPTFGTLYVLAEEGSEISIMDMNGRILAQKNIVNAEVSFDLSNIASGAYMVRILNGDRVTVEKFIKK